MALKTNFQDPDYFSQAKAEFRFAPDMLLTPDIKILNLGLVPNNDTFSNELVGVFGAIESIQLYDGATLIDQILSFAHLQGLKSVMKSNSKNQAEGNVYRRSAVGYAPQGNTAFDANGVRTNGVVVNYVPPIGRNEISSAGQPIYNGYMDLSDVLPFLAESEYVPTGFFRNLRLVINFKSASKLQDVVKDRTTPTIAEPFIQFDSYADEKLVAQMTKQYQGVQWSCWENDKIQLPAVTATAYQEENYLVNGFNDKFIGEMFLQVTPNEAGAYVTAGANDNWGPFGSMAQLDQEVQYRINGANLFVGKALVGPNRRLGITTDMLGNLDGFYGSQVAGAPVNNVVAAGIQKIVGMGSWNGCRVDQVIREMKLTFARHAVNGNAKLGGACTLNLWGNVRKVLVPNRDGASFVVSYI